MRPGCRPMPRTGRGGLSGLTLIELLLWMAILTILIVAVTHLTGQLRLATERHADGQAALDLARDQIARLRGGGELPPPGTHRADPEILAAHPEVDEAWVEIRPGPDPRLREVRVRARLRKVYVRREVELAVLLPAHRRAEETSP